jgi:hypothetical protein
MVDSTSTSQSHPWLDLYFARSSIWDWHDGSQIDIIDQQGQVTATLDTWQTWVFHEADGGRTVRNALAWLTSHYREGNPKPPDLDETILKALTFLVEDLHAVVLSDKGPVLPDYLLEPWSKQDQAEAKKQMEEDGYSQ